MARSVSDSDGRSRPGGAGSSEGEQNGRAKAAVGRRALLTRGGVVAAGVVGAGALGAAVAGPASAQATTAVDMNTANDAGTNVSQPTELDADNSTAPAFILTNTGIDTETVTTGTFGFSGPNLRLTPSPSTANGYAPTPSTEGGDLTATADGSLWFTHVFLNAELEPEPPDPAPVHTEATANVYAGVNPTIRLLDTRYADLRTNIINASGNLASSGELLSGKTIYLDLDSLVTFADNIFANLTVTAPSAAGFLTVWSGYSASGGTDVPNASTINFGKAATLSNFMACSIGVYPPGETNVDDISDFNVIAIHATNCNTHVILDVSGFTMPGFEYASGFSPETVSGSRNAAINRARLQAAQKKSQAKLRSTSKRA
jgi:hypothetical protein